MKLKIYRISLLSALIASLGLDIFFLIQAIQSIMQVQQAELMDGIMYIICLILLLFFIGLEIVNTILSFKKGSMYIKNLTYNDDGSINRNLIYVLGGLSLVSLLVILYFILIYAGISLPLSNFAREIISIIISFFTIVFVDSIFIILFPILAKEDISLQD